MSFLPEDYEAPVPTSRYWNKWEKGANKFRALGDAIVGWEWWTEEDGKKKPNRVQATYRDMIPNEYKSGENSAYFFWAFPVWDYQTKSIRILTIKQSTIWSYLEDFYKNPDWGSLKEYDVTVTAKGDGFDREYTVTPSPKKELDKDIEAEWKNTHINMQALFEGEDPFEPAEGSANGGEPEPAGKEDVDPGEVPF